jgi:hypothetical protein
MSDQILLLGGVALIKGRVKEAGMAMKHVRETLDPKLTAMHFTENAQFKTVHLIIRFGEQTDLKPSYQAINKREKELPIAIEMEMEPLRGASREVVEHVLLGATVEALLDVATKYGLPSE